MPSKELTLPDFWTTFPDAIAVEDFAFLKNKCGDEKSSRIMWYLRLTKDPDSEYLSKYPKAEREAKAMDISGFRKSDAKLEGFKRAERWYSDYWISPAAKGKVIIGDKIHEANDALNNFTIDSGGKIKEYSEAVGHYVNLTNIYKDYCDSFTAEKRKRTLQHGKDVEIGAASDRSLFKKFG